MSLLQIQAELKAPKSQHNTYGNYDYRSAEDILQAVKPLLAKYKGKLYLTDDVVAVGNHCYIKATAVFNDGSEETKVTAFAREDEARKGMSAPQMTGSASSYARKYALNGLFLIDDTKDPDTNEYRQQQPRQYQQNYQQRNYQNNYQYNNRRQ